MELPSLGFAVQGEPHGKILSQICKLCAERTLARCRDLLAHCHRAKTLSSTELRVRPRGATHVLAPLCKICIATMWQWCVTSLFSARLPHKGPVLRRGVIGGRCLLFACSICSHPRVSSGPHVCGHLGAHHVDIATLQILAEVGFTCARH